MKRLISSKNSLFCDCEKNFVIYKLHWSHKDRKRVESKMKKRILTFITAVLLVFTVLLQIPMYAAAETDDDRINAVSTATTAKHNIILLIDQSGSMNATDKNRLSLSAACQFIDQISTVSNELLDLTAAANVGVMTFSQRTDVVVPLLSLDTEANKNYLKSEIRKIKYDPVNTGGTDLSTATSDAMEMLKQQSTEGVKNIVVLFTDGYSENVLDQNASAENLKNAFRIAEELESQLYVVGLNHNGKIKEAGQQEIYNLANTVQVGEGISKKAANDKKALRDTVNYLITDNIGDVREFYGKIYANMIQSDLIYIENHEFIVDSSGILEADVTIYSDSKISEVIITDPDGNRMTEDAASYFVSGDDFYKVIKILNPKTGKWKVEVVSGDENYKSYVIKFYGVEAAVNASWDTGKNLSDSGLDVPYVGKVTVIPMYKDEVYTDEAFVQSVTKAEFTAGLEGEKEAKTYPLTFEDGAFVGYFPVEKGVYHIDAVLATDIMNRQVSCTLTVTNTGSVIPEELQFPWYYIAMIVAAIAALLAAVVVLNNKFKNIPGEFHISVELLNSENGYEREFKNNDAPSPRGKKFSLWKLTEVVKQDIDGHTEDSSEGEEEISEALANEKKNIEKVSILMSQNKRKKKIYLVKTARGNRELTDNIECYKSDKLSIRLSFESAFGDEEDDNDDFGRATDFKRKKKTRSRQASSRFYDDFDNE